VKRPLSTEDIIDEIVTDISVFFIVLFATLAMLDYFSLTLLFSGLGVLLVAGIITACLVRIGSQSQSEQRKGKDPSESDFGQVLNEVKKTPPTDGRKDSVDDLLKQPRYSSSDKPKAQSPDELQHSKN